MQVVIIEDEPIAVRRIVMLLEELQPDIQIKATLSTVLDATAWFNKNPLPDLIFLDIQLNDGYGFDILDSLEKHPPIIFTTAFNEYAMRGFKYNGIDYLLKPINKEELRISLEKFGTLNSYKSEIVGGGDLEAIRNSLLGRDYKLRFMVKVGNRFNTINTKDIAYFKSHDGVIFLHTHDGKHYPVDYTIDNLEKLVNPLYFFRVNRKYMIAVSAVQEVHNYFNSRVLVRLLPKQDEKVIVSRDRTGNFKKWLDL